MRIKNVELKINSVIKPAGMKILVIIIFPIFSVSLFGQTISGTIRDEVKNQNIPFTNIFLLDSTSQNIIHEQISDADGKFRFDKLISSTYCIKVSYSAYKDTIFRGIALVDSLVLKLDIHKPCTYDASLKNKTCPVCHESDSVIKIIYGLPIIEEVIDMKTKKVIKSGGEPMVDFYPAGCKVTYCDPNWYCKRDSTKF